jgi:hypothetical protein
VVPDLFALVHVGDVQLDHRPADPLDGVVQRERRVGQRTGVEHRADHPARFDLRTGLVNPVDQPAHVVGLAEVDLDTEPHAFVVAHPLDVGQGRRAVDAGLTGARGVQVGPVEDQDLAHAVLSPRQLEKSIHDLPGTSRTAASAAAVSATGKLACTVCSGASLPEVTDSSVAAKSCGWS